MNNAVISLNIRKSSTAVFEVDVTAKLKMVEIVSIRIVLPVVLGSPMRYMGEIFGLI